MNCINVDEIRKTISILKDPEELFEIRILAGKKVYSGYFNSADKMLKELSKLYLENANVYITLNELAGSTFSRSQREKFMCGVDTTKDPDVVGYDWFFVDVDPIRAAGISSSNEELQLARKKAEQVYNYLKNLGFNEPVQARSGNGYHLLYKIHIENTADNQRLIESCLKVLSDLFSDDDVKIDTVNANPSRICKLHGTLAQKGSDTKERPHRWSKIISDQLEYKYTEMAFLQKLASQFPDEPEKIRPKYYNTQSRNMDNQFDLMAFMDKYGLSHKPAKDTGRADMFALDECPFDSSHRNGDARIFLYPDGAVAFKCHHNSCSDKKWQDVRMLFDKDYDPNRAEDGKRYDNYLLHNRDKQSNALVYEELDTEEVDKMFRNAEQIASDPEPEKEYIKSGITEIDKLMHGLQKGHLTIISGLRGCGKSTLLGNITLNSIEYDQTVLCYSGELTSKKYLRWLQRQAAGKHVVFNTTAGYQVSDEDSKKINEWMGKRFYLYDNNYGNNFQKVKQAIIQKNKDIKADLIIIDNMMALQLDGYRQDKYDAQTDFLWDLKDLASKTNTHIILVAHPRKTNGMLRLNDISGSGNVGNIIDNAFIMHRWNRDFENGYKEFTGELPEKDIQKCSNVVEIAKDREEGTMDYFFPLWFEESTKRLRNSPDEYIRYGWDTDETGFADADSDDEPIPFEEV